MFFALLHVHVDDNTVLIQSFCLARFAYKTRGGVDMLFAVGNSNFLESGAILFPTEAEILAAGDRMALVAVVPKPASRSTATARKVEFVLCPINPPGKVEGKLVEHPSCSATYKNSEHGVDWLVRRVDEERPIPPSGTLLTYALRAGAQYVEVSPQEFLETGVRVKSVLMERKEFSRKGSETIYYAHVEVGVRGINVEGWVALWEDTGVNAEVDAFLATKVVKQVRDMHPGMLKGSLWSASYSLMDLEVLRHVMKSCTPRETDRKGEGN